MGIYDTSVVVVVSDHGDQFYEHGSVGHGDTVYQELTHVPMIIRAPGLLPKGGVVDADVEMMDMAPTLMDLAGAKPDPKMQGATLVPLAFDEIGVSPRAALTVDGQVARGLKVDRYRLVHRGPGRMELYDELADPREQKDVAADHPIALRRNARRPRVAARATRPPGRRPSGAPPPTSPSPSTPRPGRPGIWVPR